MSTTGLEVFDSTLQQTNEWLGDISAALGWGDRQLAYEALRGTLHAVRDHLPVDEAAHLSAQLPMLVRGIFYEGWDPSRVPVRERSREEFLRRVAEAFRGAARVSPEEAARAVLMVLAGRVSAGQFDQVRAMMPEEVRGLWPGPVRPG
jgi:uncharacterized protein (DUF2267 family)